MTNQQGAPEALRLAAIANSDGHITNIERNQIARELSRLHAENERLAALVEAQQPASSAAGFDVLRNVATLWAWMAIDGMEQLRNLAYGFGDAETALKSVESQYKRCREASDALNVYMAACAPTPQADSQPAPAETMTLQEVWNAAGGNPGIKPTRDDVLLALKTLDEVCDEVGRAKAPAAGAVAGPTYRIRTKKDVSQQWRSVSEPEYRDALAMPEIFDCEEAAAPTPAAQAADSVLEDAARWISTAQAELDGVETEDANNCLKAARGALEKALAAARKQGGA